MAAKKAPAKKAPKKKEEPVLPNAHELPSGGWANVEVLKDKNEINVSGGIPATGESLEEFAEHLQGVAASLSMYFGASGLFPTARTVKSVSEELERSRAALQEVVESLIDFEPEAAVFSPKVLRELRRTSLSRGTINLLTNISERSDAYWEDE